MRSMSVRSVVAVLAVASIGGCSGSSTEVAGPSVASVPRANSSTKAAPATTAAVERPLIRLDTTPEEMDRMFDAYDKCLRDHGVPSKEMTVKLKTRSVDPKAQAACAGKAPDDYQEKMKREDPAGFKDKQRIQVKCMRDHGLAIETSSDGWGYTNPARDMGSTWDKKCERQAFG
jgi:hypothetical protein